MGDQSDLEASLDDWLDYDVAEEPDAAPAWLRWGVIAAVATTLLGLVVLWPPNTTVDSNALSVLGVPSSFHQASVLAVVEEPCPFLEESDCVSVEFEIMAGPDAGAIYEQTFPAGGTSPEFAEGTSAILSRRDPDGTVVEGRQQACSFDSTIECRLLRIRLADESATIVEAEVSPDNPAYASFAGDELNLELFDEGGEYVVFGASVPTVATTYQFADFQRRSLLGWLLAAFAVAVVVVGRRQGLLALGGLALSVAVLLLFVVRGIVAGGNPLPIAIVGAAAITIVTLYMAHGFDRGSSVALLGVFGAILLTAGLGLLTLGLANVTGFSTEEASLLTLFEDIQVTGLLLAGVVLGAAGALDDVAVTQAAAVREIHQADPSLDRSELYRRGMRIGRDHIASTVNTLLLAYAGASLPLLVLFVLSAQSLGTVLNSEVVSIEVIRTVVGSFGLLATVPLTTWLAAAATKPAAATRPT